jgi:proline iminopeptidase
MNSTGVAGSILQLIADACFTYKKVRAVIIYGSRARGDYKQGSDIDLAIDAPELSETEFAKLWNELDDLPIIYPMDVVHLQSIKNKTLVDAITQEGIALPLVG